MLRFHVVGHFLPEHVHAVWVESARQIVPEIEAKIDRAWRIALARPGVKLFDGPMCRLEFWQIDGATLNLRFSPTTYRAFLGTNLSHPELADEYGREVLANPVGVSPALLTADGWVMLGQRNASVAYHPNRVHPFAGALEPRDALDVFSAVRRELAEELSFTSDDITEVVCTGIAEDIALRQPELIFYARSTRTRAQIESRVDQAEHHGSWHCPATREGIEQAIRDPILTPVAVAGLLLWGRGAFGEAWFDEHGCPAKVE